MPTSTLEQWKTEAKAQVALCGGFDAQLPTEETLARRILALIEVVEAADKLAKQLGIVHEDSAYESVWTLHHIHGGKYDGPSYSNELESLNAALKRLEE